MAKTTILIVEDDRELREALSTTLEIAGYHCVTADSAESAIPILEKQAVELVVSDVNMPGMNGHELLEHIHRQFPGIPAMLITAYGQISDAVSAMQSGAVDYIVKPFEPNVLIESVKRVLGNVNTSKEGLAKAGNSSSASAVLLDGFSHSTIAAWKIAPASILNPAFSSMVLPA